MVEPKKNGGRAGAANEQGSATGMAIDGKIPGFGGDKYFTPPLKLYFSRIDNNIHLLLEVLSLLENRFKRMYQSQHAINWTKRVRS